MKTWLFVWNPKRWSWDDPIEGWKELRNDISQVGNAYMPWTCGMTNSIRKGDRIFLIRLGVENKGIVASGYAATPVFEGVHWDLERRSKGILARRIFIKFDKILDCDDVILNYERLLKLSADYNWSPMSSGVQIPFPLCKSLDDLWKMY